MNPSLPSASSATIPKEPSPLKRLALKGSAWVIFGIGINQALRLVGNVILARLLAPEVFGIMGIVNGLRMGLEMFSDIGLRQSIIQNRRGEESAFLRTAWTLQVIRGIIITLLAAALAWPLATINNESSLTLIIFVTGLTAIIAGFNSTWLLVYSRRMLLAQTTILDLTAYIFNLLAMIVCAWYFRSVWALVLGAFIGNIIRLIVSHTLLAGVSMRFQLESEAVNELIRFGRWVFISTALGFLVMRLDVFLIGGYAGMTMLGLYVLAKNLANLVTQALGALSSKILFPVYTRLAEQGYETLRNRTKKVRILLLTAFLPPLWILILWGDQLVALLYDERYLEAGWILQILAAGAIATAIRFTIIPVLLAVGDSFRHMIGTAIRFGLQIVSIVVGIYFAGMSGFFIGIALTDLLSYPALIYLIRPYRVWLPFVDAVAFGTSFIVIGIAFWPHFWY